MNDHIDINKLRKFSLFIGLIFLVYSISGIQIDIKEKISLFGFPIILTRPNLIEFSFLIVSIYCLLRYFIFGIVIGLHPRAARKHLIQGTLANGNNYAENIEVFRVLARQDIEKYFPILEPPHNVKWSVVAVNNCFQIKIELSRLAKIFGVIHDLDFCLPIIINIVAILVFFIF
jgi:hypothetical protein